MLLSLASNTHIGCCIIKILVIAQTLKDSIAYNRIPEHNTSSITTILASYNRLSYKSLINYNYLVQDNNYLIVYL